MRSAFLLLLMIYGFLLSTSFRRHVFLNQHTRRATSTASFSAAVPDAPSTATKQYREMVYAGESAIDRLVQKANHHVPPTLSPSEFRLWAKEICERKFRTDAEFRQRIGVRELRKRFVAEISECESTVLVAKAAYEKDPNAVRLTELDRAISNGLQATNNMERLLSDADNWLVEGANGDDDGNESSGGGGGVDDGDMGGEDPTVLPRDRKLFERVDRVRQAYPIKLEDLRLNLEERDRLRQSTPAFHAYQESMERLEALYERIGLNAAEDSLTSVQKTGGQGRNHRGRSFENTADAVLTEFLLPYLAAKHGFNVSDLIVVRNIKLGMASSKGSTAELDSLVCVRRARPESLDHKPRGSWVLVLGVVEVKRNADDIGAAFVSLQKSVAWLAGLKELYDPATWVTKAYPRGHFERPFLQDFHGESLIFTAASFAGLRRSKVAMHLPAELSRFYCNAEDAGDVKDCLCFVEDLFFVTRDGALDSVQSKALSWVLSKISAEVEFDMDLSDPLALESLRLRVEERHPHRLSTLDLLHTLRANKLLDQIFVVADEIR
jgi:hypothetical protein